MQRGRNRGGRATRWSKPYEGAVLAKIVGASTTRACRSLLVTYTNQLNNALKANFLTKNQHFFRLRRQFTQPERVRVRLRFRPVRFASLSLCSFRFAVCMTLGVKTTRNVEARRRHCRWIHRTLRATEALPPSASFCQIELSPPFLATRRVHGRKHSAALNGACVALETLKDFETTKPK